MTTKTKAHQIYRLQSGEIVPGVTTILGIVAKPALAPAANKLGLLGINSTIHWRELAGIGTLSHHLTLCHLKKVKPDTSDYRKDLIDKAENSFLSYLEWEKNHKIEPVLLETPLTTEILKFGGTPDCVCHLDEKTELTLMDYKSGGIYKEAYWQIAAYEYLLGSNGYIIADGIILGIPRTVDESFDDRWLDKDRLQLGLKPFLSFLNSYNADKEYQTAIKESENQIKEER